ncbi:hypothetical protein [Streptococcus uberis]|uniref:hypothetical protein n=1 Tax=Streptococcus uberis TaxID=1349 RepID=UPI0012D3E266|nr:hypothetical protein [Streptococcus uberis]
MSWRKLKDMNELNLTIEQNLVLIAVLSIILAIELYTLYHSKTEIAPLAQPPQTPKQTVYLERYGAYIQLAGHYYN